MRVYDCVCDCVIAVWCVAVYMNMMSAFFYEFTSGDKETFHYSWRVMEAPFTMIPHPVGAAGIVKQGTGPDGTFYGTTMVQHGLNGQRLFFHRNLKKWPSMYNPTVIANLSAAQRAWVQVKECAGGTWVQGAGSGAVVGYPGRVRREDASEKCNETVCDGGRGSAGLCVSIDMGEW